MFIVTLCGDCFYYFVPSELMKLSHVLYYPLVIVQTKNKL